MPSTDHVNQLHRRELQHRPGTKKTREEPKGSLLMDIRLVHLNIMTAIIL